MPTKLVIINGPPFKKFFNRSSVFSDERQTLTFSLSPAQSRGRPQVKFEITSMGRSLQLKSGGNEEDLYNFIGFAIGANTTVRERYSSTEMFFPHFYYVGQYNTRTRQGVCLEMDAKEFFNLPIGALLLGDEAKKFYRENYWMK